ncbi:unnamed protein product [Diamesa tonsa]
MNLIESFCVGGLLLILSSPLLKKLYNRWILERTINKIPGPKTYPLIGTSFHFTSIPREKRFYKLVEFAKTYKRFYRLWNGLAPEVRILRGDYAETILKSSKHNEKSFTYNFAKPWLGDGLLIAKGERWFKHRKIITPTFHFSVLDTFCEVFGENGNSLVNELNKLSGDVGKPINIYPLITRAALSIICETAMGIKVQTQQQSQDSDNDYVKSVYAFSEMAMQRIFKPWLRIGFIWERSSMYKQYTETLNILHNFTMKVIQERKLARQIEKANNEISSNDDNNIGRKKRRAFLDLLLDGNEKENLLTDDDIRQEVDTFMFEGHDTTTAGISWALFLIGSHDDVQEKIVEEMNRIFGDDKSQIATIHQLNDMKYLEQVLKEALRLFPSVPTMGRKLSEDIEIEGYKIPKDSFVAIQVYFIHRDERHFPDPEKFDPDRFLPENAEHRPPYAYIPFSAGPRNCIGQKFAMLEEKSIISSIIRNFNIKSVDTLDEITLISEIILRPLNGINLILENR